MDDFEDVVKPANWDAKCHELTGKDSDKHKLERASNYASVIVRWKAWLVDNLPNKSDRAPRMEHPVDGLTSILLEED